MTTQVDRIPSPPPPAPSPDARGPGSLTQRLLCILAIIGLSLGFSYMILVYSYWHGRLATIPQFDDCGYMYDGAIRLQRMKTEGLFNFFTTYASPFPHSPFSTMLALVSYAIMGVRNVAPYAGNTILIVALLAYVHWRLKQYVWWKQVLGFIFVLSVPYNGSLVFEFRPDLACAMFISMGIVSALMREWTNSPWKHRACIGVIFAIAMLTKPSVFPQTCIYFGLSLFLCFLIDRQTSQVKPTFVQFLKSCIVPLVIFLLIILPHFSLTIVYLVTYIRHGLLDERSVWVDKGSILHQGWYYLGGEAGKLMLNKHLYIISALIGALIVVEFRTGFLKERRLRYAAIAGIVAFAYAFPTINTVKTHFFGANFHSLFMLLGVFSLFELSDWLNAQRPMMGNLLLGAACVAGVATYSFPERYAERDSAEYAARAESNRQLYEEIKKRTHRAEKPAKCVFYACVGPINAVTISLLYLKDNLTPPKYTYAYLMFKPDEFPPLLEEADLVVVAEPNNIENYNWLPLGQHQYEILEALRVDPRFKEAARIDTFNHRGFILFEKIGTVGGEKFIESLFKRGFEGFTDVAGLAPVEGPYPQWKMPIVRWGNYPQTRIASDITTDGRVHLELQCTAHVPKQTITVKVGDKVILQRAFKDNGDFDKFEADFDLPAKGEIVFDYAVGNNDPTKPADAKPTAVLFRTIRLTPVGGPPK